MFRILWCCFIMDFIHIKYMVLLILVASLKLCLGEPNTLLQNYDCGDVPAVLSTPNYKGSLPIAMSYLADEIRDAWTTKQEQIQTRMNAGGSWEPIIVKIMNVLSGNTYGEEEDPNKCTPMSIHYRGGCRQSTTCISNLVCKACIMNVATQIINLCAYSKMANGYTSDCFVRYRNTPFTFLEVWPELPNNENLPPRV